MIWKVTIWNKKVIIPPANANFVNTIPYTNQNVNGLLYSFWLFLSRIKAQSVITELNTPCAQRYWRKQHKILAFKPGIPPKTHRTIPLIFRSLLVSL